MQNIFKFIKIMFVIIGIMIFLPFFLIGIGFIIASYYVDPSSLTDDGYNLSNFLLSMGGFFLVGSISTFGFLIPAFIIIKYVEKQSIKKQKLIENLKVTGLKGKAIVLKADTTGLYINRNPQVSLLLEIHIDGRSPYQVQKTETVSIIKTSQVEVGNEIDILVDSQEPHNTNKIILMFR